MQLMDTCRLCVTCLVVSLVAAACVQAGASAAPGSTSVSSDLSLLSLAVISQVKVDTGPLPSGAPAPKVDASTAIKTATANLYGEHGPLLALGRGRAKKFEDATEPVRTVWVAVFGPGGTVPLQGPDGGLAPISLQVVLIDDQSGEFLRDDIESAPALPSTVGPSPSAVEPTPSAAVTSIPLSLGAGHMLTLTVTDRSGQLLAVRSAKPEELAAPDLASANADIFVYAPSRGSDQLVVVWVGVICDRAADLVIEPRVDRIAVQAHPAEPCDAMAVPRGVVLTFDRPIEPSALSLDLSHP